MTYYFHIENDKIVGKGQAKLLNAKNIVVTKEVYDESEKYIYQDGGIILNPNYEEEQALKEKERVGNLKCTKRVFALMLQELGVDYITVLLPLIESNSQAKLEWDLCVELERKNPLLDIMAGQLGVTPEQLDGLFKYANGEITVDEFKALCVKPDEELPTDEIVLPDEPIEETEDEIS